MVRAWWIARFELLRLLRDRSNLFFVFVLPLLLVTLIGAQFGSSFDAQLGVVLPDDDGDAAALVAALDATDGLETQRFDDVGALEAAVSRGDLSAGLVIPDGYGAAVDAVQPVALEMFARPDTTAMSLQTLVEAVIADRAAAGTAAAIAGTVTGAPAAELLPIATELRSEVGGLDVVTTTVGEDELAREFAGLGQFDLGASSQLFLFTFLTSMTAGIALIQTRQLGIARRMVGTPSSMAAIVAGQAGGRFLVALTQALYLVGATLLLFRVDWGDPLATSAVVVLFCLVSAAAGLVVGAVFRNESQASGAGIGLGIGLAAIGGSMVPLELFPPGVRMAARATPHAWANEAMAEVVRRGGGVTDILPQLAALAGFAIVLFSIGAWQLRRVLSR